MPATYPPILRKNSQMRHQSLALHVLGDWFITDTLIPPLCMVLKSYPPFFFTDSAIPPSTPETFDIVSSTVGIDARKNLAQISKVLTQITGGSEFGEDSPSYLPINEFVRKAIAQMSAWLIEGNGRHSLFQAVAHLQYQLPMFRMPRASFMRTSSLMLRFNRSRSTSLPTKCTLCIRYCLRIRIHWYILLLFYQLLFLTSGSGSYPRRCLESHSH